MPQSIAAFDGLDLPLFAISKCYNKFLSMEVKLIRKIALVVLVLCGILMAAPGYADEITVQMKGATVTEVATAIATEGNVAVILDKNVDGNLKIPLIDFQNIPTENALLKLTSAASLAMTYTVAPNFKSNFGIPSYFFNQAKFCFPAPIVIANSTAACGTTSHEAIFLLNPV